MPSRRAIGDCAQAGIAAAALDLAQNGGKARGTSAALFRQVARVTFRSKNEGNEIVDMRDDEVAMRRVRAIRLGELRRRSRSAAADPRYYSGSAVPCRHRGRRYLASRMARGSRKAMCREGVPIDHVDRMRGARQHGLSLPDHRFAAALA